MSEHFGASLVEEAMPPSSVAKIVSKSVIELLFNAQFVQEALLVLLTLFLKSEASPRIVISAITDLLFSCR